MSVRGSDGAPRPDLRHLVPVPPRSGQPSTAAADVVGVDLAGAPATVRVGDAVRTLLLFLSSDCDGCRPFWPAAGDPAALGLVAGETTVVVARDVAREDAALLARLARPGSTVVLSGEAWSAYRVQGPPFFALVDAAAGRVVTEGVAWSVLQVAADVRRARGRLGAPAH